MKWKKFLSTIICVTMVVSTPVEATLAETLEENTEIAEEYQIGDDIEDSAAHWNKEDLEGSENWIRENVIAEEYQFEENAESNEYWIEENTESVSDGLTDSAEISDGFEDGTADNWEVNEFESDPQEEEKQAEDEIAGFADAQNTEEANADDSLTLEERDQKLQEMVEKIITYLDLEEKSEYEKIYAIYNYVCENVEYDYSVLDKEDNWDGVSLGYGQFAYEALCEGKAVCAGIARGIVELMEYAGIECHYIDGWAQNGITHAWNLVRIGDLYYYIDATTDLGQENYRGFLKGSND